MNRNRICHSESNSFVIAQNKYGLSLFLNTASNKADVTSLGRPFHTFAPVRQCLSVCLCEVLNVDDKLPAVNTADHTRALSRSVNQLAPAHVLCRLPASYIQRTHKRHQCVYSLSVEQRTHHIIIIHTFHFIYSNWTRFNDFRHFASRM